MMDKLVTEAMDCYGVPIAAVVRAAVDEYLAKQDSET